MPRSGAPIVDNQRLFEITKNIWHQTAFLVFLVNEIIFSTFSKTNSLQGKF